MMERIRLTALAVSALLLIASSAWGQNLHGHDTKPELFCGECHVCAHPTADQPCLRECPRERVEQRPVDESGPGYVMIDELEMEYEAVYFSHELHAKMSAMGHGCLDCHHYSTIEQISACKDCHPVHVDDENLRQPGLRGAYHRQCMSCHQAWAGESSCEVCHARKTEDGIARTDTIPPRPGRHYTNLTEPDIKIWESSYGGGTIVTLHHKNHTERYGIECAACHHQEGCSFCHTQDKNRQPVRHSEAALHGICNSCHEEMSCNQCHLQEVAEEFSHSRTGWPLKRYHARVSCAECHGEPHHFTKPAAECSHCHRPWNPETFNHRVVGLELDETHLEADCSDCHGTGDYADPPSCADCHDEDVAFPKQLPGRRL